MRRLTLGFAGIFLGLSAWTACTGEDPDTIQSGAVGQPCKTGGTCNAPELKCVSGVCQTVSSSASGSSTTGGASTSSSSSSGGSSSSSGAASSSSSSSSSSSGDPDAGIEVRLDVTADTCEEPIFKGGPYCPGVAGQACASGQACCPDGTSQTKCDVPSCAPDLVWTCETKTHCPGSSVCCITAQKKAASPICTDYEVLNAATSACKPTNADCKLPEQWKTCTGGGDCDSNDCVQREIITKEGLRIVLHVCEQQF